MFITDTGDLEITLTLATGGSSQLDLMPSGSCKSIVDFDLVARPLAITDCRVH